MQTSLTLNFIFMNHVLTVDFFGTDVRAETNGTVVCVNDLIRAGNKWRIMHDMAPMTVQQLTHSNAKYKEFLSAAAIEYRMDESAMHYVVGRGGTARTMVHIAVAIFVAEQLSPEFHVKVIKTFLEGKLLEFRAMGGTEFKELNAAIDLYLPDRIGKDNKGCYINAAKIMRKRLLGSEDASSWDTASVAQTHSRYDLEKTAVRMMASGFVKDWEQLKEVLHRL